MGKRNVNILIGIGLAVIVIMLVHGEMAKREDYIQRLIQEGRAAQVVVATRDIPSETIVEPDMVQVRTVAATSLQRGDLTSLESAIGSITTGSVLRGQHMNSSFLRGTEAIRYLSHAIPEGFRAITIPIEQVEAIEGLLKPGDRVDIVGSFQLPAGPERTESVVVNLFEGVRILAVNRNFSPFRIETKVESITFALQPEEAQILTYSMQAGRIRLALRAPRDEATGQYSLVGMHTLLKKLGFSVPEVPPEEIEPAAAERKKDYERTIEVYRGPALEDMPVR